MAGRVSKAKRNITYGMLSKVLTILLEFVARYFFIKYLGEELLGVNGVFTNVIQVLSLAELGMNNVVNFSFYEPLAKGDHRKLSALVTFYKKIYNGIALVVLFVGVALTPFLKHIINLDHEINGLYIIYYIFLFDTVFSYLFVYQYSILSADQNGYVYSKYEIVRNIIRTLLQIVSLIILKSIIVYLLIKSVMTIGMNILLARKAEREYPYIKEKKQLDSKEKNSIIATIKSGFVYKLSAILLNSTDNILVSMIVGTVWVGYLSNYITIQTGISSFYTIIFTSLVAGIGNLMATSTKEKSLEVFENLLFAAGWLGGVISACYFVLSGEFVTLWLGEQYVMDDSVVLSKSIMLFLSCTMNPLFSYREALGLYRKTKYSILAAAIINILLSIWWGNLWGITGILNASLVSVWITYFWYEPVILYKDHFSSNPLNYFKSAGLYWFVFAALIVVTNYLSKILVADNWISWILKAAFVFVFCNIYYLIIFFKGKNFKLLIGRLRTRGQ